MRRRLALASKQPERLLNSPNAIIDHFLCQVLRGEPAPWEELPGTIAADDLNERCRHHGVQSLLYHAMHQRPEWSGWPPQLQQELQAASKAGIAQDLLRSHCLQQLLNSLSRHRVRVILTKGEALALSLYAIPGTRTRSDTDLFIPIAGLMRAQQAVHDAGFEIHAPIYKSHQFTVTRKVDPTYAVRFDIHWRIQNSPRFARAISFEEGYANSVELANMGGIRVLDAVDALLLACMHRWGNERHDRARLIWIYDIHLLISSLPESRLREFAHKAVKRNVHLACLDGVSRAMELFHTSVPGEVLALLSSPEPKRTWARRFAASNLGLLVDDWQLLPDGRSRLNLLKELFLLSSDALMLKYHKSSKVWLPYLYFRQILGGFTQRLLLR